jgi:hypothetical protein
MSEPNWLLLLDHRHARLLQGRQTNGSGALLDEIAALVNDAPEIERDRPTMLAGHGAHAYAAPHHVDEEERRRWAHKAALWMKQEMGARRIRRVSVLAPAHLLGSLRRAWPPEVGPYVDDEAGEFAGLSLGELSRHPRILRLVGRTAS